MAILNSRFAFLAADFENPNLNQDKNKVDQTTSDSSEKNEFKSVNRKPLKKPPIIYLKSIPLFVYVNAVPADIYSASLFLLVKNL